MGKDQCGVELTMTRINPRETYYMPALQQKVKRCLATNSRMKNLPVKRRARDFVFEHVVASFYRAFLIKSRSLQNWKATKLYLVVYVFIVTKATDIEVCSDLSTNA